MDVAGLGVDIVEIGRMKTILERTPSFRTHVFSEGERAYCDAKAMPEIHYALRFAAKEAVLKALGTGFAGVAVTDVEVENDEHGRPHALLHGNAERIAKEQGVVEMHISLSYTHEVGVANAVAITEDARPHEEPHPDPIADLDTAFKEARALLDEEGTDNAADKDRADNAADKNRADGDRTHEDREDDDLK